MIIQPFNVRSRSKRYDFVDRDLLDSEETKRRVDKIHAAALDFTQHDALCNNRGLSDRREIDNKILSVFDGGNLIGIWMLGSISYVSGPWEDLQSWNVMNPGADVILDAVPMPGVRTMVQDVEAEFAANTIDLLVSQKRLGMISGQGLAIGLRKLHFGIFLNRTDPPSVRVQGQYAACKVHPRLAVTEAPHPSIAGMTLVEVCAK